MTTEATRRPKLKSQKSESRIRNYPKVVVVDYRTSNLLSIMKALQHVGAEVKLTQDAEQIREADKLVLPGVGSFGAAMRNIETLGIKDALVDFGKSGKPMMGICLGMQLLFNVSFELGIYEGLSLVPGEVVAFSSTVKVPHMGWNQVELKKTSRLFQGLSNFEYAYFVHSYFVKAEADYVSGVTDYGLKFPAIIERENVFGIQFHPEKSQSFGLKILENFLSI
ncbi:MAG: imidazole glycerol phosphate synthase subunit HisH [Candidatus Kryptoniota bacterium]